MRTESNMTSHLFAFGTMLLAALHVSSASAQTRLNSGDLVDSLQGGAPTATVVAQIAAAALELVAAVNALQDATQRGCAPA